MEALGEVGLEAPRMRIRVLCDGFLILFPIHLRGVYGHIFDRSVNDKLFKFSVADPQARPVHIVIDVPIDVLPIAAIDAKIHETTEPAQKLFRSLVNPCVMAHLPVTFPCFQHGYA
jgi:hypothetical protein